MFPRSGAVLALLCVSAAVAGDDYAYPLRQQPVRPGRLATEWTQSVNRSSIFTSVEVRASNAVGCDDMPLQIRVGCGTGVYKSACDSPDYTAEVWVTSARGAPGYFVPLPNPIQVNATDANDGGPGLFHVWITVSDAYYATECTGVIDLTLHSMPIDATPSPTTRWSVTEYMTCHPVSTHCTGPEVFYPLGYTTQFISPCHGGREAGSELTVTTDDHIFYNIRYRAANHVDTVEGTVRCGTCTWKTGAGLYDFSIMFACPAPVPGVPTPQPRTPPSPQDPLTCSYPAADYKMGSVQLTSCTGNCSFSSVVDFPLGVRREICDPCHGPHVGGHMMIASIDHVSYTMVYNEDDVTMVYTVQCGTCISQQTGYHNPFEVTIVCPPPPTPAPPLPTGTDEDNRMVAFMANWQACPSEEVTNEYSHLLVSFAVTYKWAPMANQCDTACTIKTPLVCDNAKQPELIDKWRAAGKKVLLSFGGGGMGGSWDGVNRCWEHCFGKEDSVVSQLRNLVQTDNYDGVAIDYEFYHDGSYPRKADAQHFLRTVTQKLKQELPADRNIVVHTPMDSDMEVGRGYYEVVKEVGAASIDFLMPQYYNGITRPNQDGFASARSNFNNLVLNVYNGDATRLVFGFCISDCSGTKTNANAQQAVAVMQTLQAEHPCHGGAGFWVVHDDLKGAWSRTVQNVYRHKRGCKGGSTPATPTPPTLMPPAATPTPPVATPTPHTLTPPVATPTPPATTPLPLTALPLTALPATPLPHTSLPATPFPGTPLPLTALPATPLPATPLPLTSLPATPLPLTSLPATPLPATPLPLTSLPATPLPHTSLPATPLPATPLPLTALPATPLPATLLPETLLPATLQPPASTGTCKRALNGSTTHAAATSCTHSSCGFVYFPQGVATEYCDPCLGPQPGSFVTVMTVVKDDAVQHTIIFDNGEFTLSQTLHCGQCFKQRLGMLAQIAMMIPCPEQAAAPTAPAPTVSSTSLIVIAALTGGVLLGGIFYFVSRKCASRKPVHSSHVRNRPPPPGDADYIELMLVEDDSGLLV